MKGLYKTMETSMRLIEKIDAINAELTAWSRSVTFEKDNFIRDVSLSTGEDIVNVDLTAIPFSDIRQGYINALITEREKLEILLETELNTIKKYGKDEVIKLTESQKEPNTEPKENPKKTQPFFSSKKKIKKPKKTQKKPKPFLNDETPLFVHEHLNRDHLFHRESPDVI